MFSGISGKEEHPFVFGGKYANNEGLASGVSGSHFATMREGMPKLKIEDAEKPAEGSWVLGTLFEPISNPT